MLYSTVLGGSYFGREHQNKSGKGERVTAIGKNQRDGSVEQDGLNERMLSGENHRDQNAGVKQLKGGGKTVDFRKQSMLLPPAASSSWLWTGVTSFFVT